MRVLHAVSALRRGLCTPAAGIAGRVQQIAAANGGASSLDDLQVKFKVLSACEVELGLPLHHSDLNRIASLDDAVRVFESVDERHAEMRRKEEAHWTRNLPPNVSIETKPRAKLYNVHHRDPRHYKHPSHNDPRAELAADEAEQER